MTRRLQIVIALCSLNGACVDVPRPARQAAVVGDASLVSELSSDASLLRPPTGQPYPARDGLTPSAAQSPDGGVPRDRDPEAPTDPAAARPEAAMGSAGSGEMSVTSPAASAPADAGAVGTSPSVPSYRAPHAGEIVITEIMSNPEAVPDTDGEWLELYNKNPSEALELGNCALDDGGKNPHAFPASLPIQPEGFVTIARGPNAGFASTLSLPISLSNSADSVAVSCVGTEIDRVTYGPGFPLAPGASMALDPTALDAVLNDTASHWCLSRASYGDGMDHGTPGAPNPSCVVADGDAGDAG